MIGDLFDDPETERKNERLFETLDEINERLGASSPEAFAGLERVSTPPSCHKNGNPIAYRR